MALPEFSEDFVAVAAGFGLKRNELEKFVGQYFGHFGRLPNREELAVCGALWSEHCSYKSSKVHLRRFHTEEPWVLQGPGENAGVVSITKDWAVAFKMESHNHPSYIEPYQGAATGVGGILRDVFCMGARPVASLNCLRYGEGAWNANLIKQTVLGIGDYGNSVGVPTLTGDTSFHAGYSKNILINAFTAGVIHKDRIFKGVLTEEGNSDSTETKQAVSAAKNLTLNVGSPLTAELKQVLFPEHENVLIYFGSATGRDGVHGATMSSSEFSPTGESLKPTVQVGDPFAEKVLLEATLKLISEGLCVGLQDMGAAGLTSSSVEMAGRSGCGVAINLNAIPSRASNLQAFEYLLSESQERMLAACTPERVKDVMACLAEFDIQAAVVGRVNHTGKFVCVYDNALCTAIPVEFLIEDIPKYEWPVANRQEYLAQKTRLVNKAVQPVNTKNTAERPALALDGKNAIAYASVQKGCSLNDFLTQNPDAVTGLFAHPAFASRKPITDRYCATVQGNTVAGCGNLQTASCAVVRLPRQAQEPLTEVNPKITDVNPKITDVNPKITDVGLAIAGGCEERWVELDPYAGAALSTLKVARKIIAVGGTPLALTDCLNFGSPTNPLVMRQISDAVDGITLVAKELKIPVVSGNVSLNNQTDGEPIPPTPMIGIVGRVNSVANLPLSALPSTFARRNSSANTTDEVTLVRVALPQSAERSSFACSQTAWILGGENMGPVPQLDLKSEAQLWTGVHRILEKFKPLLCFPVGHGGTFFAVAQTALASKSQLHFAAEFLAHPASVALAEGNMGFVFGFLSSEVSLSDLAGLADVVANLGLTLEPLGTLVPASSPTSNSTPALRHAQAWPLAQWQQASEDGLGRFFATRFAHALEN